MITSSVPVATAPSAQSSDGVVIALVVALVVAVVGFVVWKYMGRDGGGSGGGGYEYGDGTAAFDWMNTNAPTYYPTAIPSQQPMMADQYQYAAQPVESEQYAA